MVSNARRQPASPGTGQELLHACSWCNKVLIDGQWMELDTALDRFRVGEIVHIPPVSHGICPECRQRIMLAYDRRNRRDQALRALSVLS